MGKGNHQADISNSNQTSLDHNNHDYKAAMDNHANQLNPTHDEYWHSRGQENPHRK